VSAVLPKEVIFQRGTCRTAVPTGEVHRLPQKVRVFIDAAARSQASAAVSRSQI